MLIVLRIIVDNLFFLALFLEDAFFAMETLAGIVAAFCFFALM